MGNSPACSLQMVGGLAGISWRILQCCDHSMDPEMERLPSAKGERGEI